MDMRRVDGLRIVSDDLVSVVTYLTDLYKKVQPRIQEAGLGHTDVGVNLTYTGEEGQPVYVVRIERQFSRAPHSNEEIDTLIHKAFPDYKGRISITDGRNHPYPVDDVLNLHFLNDLLSIKKLPFAQQFRRTGSDR